MNVLLKSVVLRGAGLLAVLLLLVAVPVEAVQAKAEISDQSVTDAVDDALLQDPAVVSTRVDVSTTDGIVTLTGEVDNILAKERAARVAEAIKGVRSVINRLQVDPATPRSDAQVRRDIEAALLEDPATETYEINPVVQDGEVTLTGTVDSYQERELAKKVVKGVRGVRSIDDQIEIQYRQDRSDIETKNEIERMLHWNTYVDNMLIDVDVDDGQVTLSGTVGSAAEKRLAEAAAWVAGVKSVDSSELSVEGWARDEDLREDKYVVKSEKELNAAIQDALLYDPRVNSFDIEVDVVGGFVTLRGEVDNLKAKRAAEQNAKNTVGVASVKNRLKVRTNVTSSDREIAEEIRTALLRDPYVERFEIDVTVLDGTAHLYGTVDSNYEKNRADDVASRVAGVLDVENHIEVNLDTAYLYDPYVDDVYVEQDDWIDYERRNPLQTDAELKDSIEGELFWSPFVDSDDVEVSVDDGKARLTGTVATWEESRAATENAYEGGATLVDNDLNVANSADSE